MNARKKRRLDLLCEFNFDIKNINGKEDKVVDALSRRIHVMHAIVVSV